MTLNDLATKTLLSQVTRGNGASEFVNYNHRESGLKEEDLPCFPQDITYGEQGRDTENDWVEFHALQLEESPKKGDSIEWNDQFYQLDKVLTQITNGIYDVRCYKKRHIRGSR